MNIKDHANKEGQRAILHLDNPSKMAHDAVATDNPELNQDWKPPRPLESPPAPAGYHTSWIRTNLGKGGVFDASNIREKLREGWRFCTVADIPAGYHFESTALEHLNGGKEVITIQDMVLMKFPLRMKRQRDAYYANRANAQVRGVDNILNAEKAKSGARLFVEQSTRNSTELRAAPLDDGD